VLPDSSYSPGWNWKHWRNNDCGHNNVRSLLEDCSSTPPSQVLPFLDAETGADSAMVDRHSNPGIALSVNNQNRQRTLSCDNVLAKSNYGRGKPEFLMVQKLQLRRDAQADISHDDIRQSLITNAT